MITPQDIEYKEFTKAVRGYKEEEVDEFLDLIIVDLENLIRENKKLKAELEKAKSQVDKHVSSESTIYETLESAKALMSDIAASSERRAEVLLKNAELEAELITKEARESISKLTDDGNKLRSSIDNFKTRYKRILEDELERINYIGNDLFEDFEKEFLPRADAAKEASETKVLEKMPEKKEEQKLDLSKTIVY